MVCFLPDAPGLGQESSCLNVPQRRLCIEVFFIERHREKHLQFEKIDIIAMFFSQIVLESTFRLMYVTAFHHFALSKTTPIMKR